MLTLEQLQAHREELEAQRTQLLATQVMADFAAVSGALQSLGHLIELCETPLGDDESEAPCNSQAPSGLE